MNEYLLDPSPRLLAELAHDRSMFNAATAHLEGRDRLERELGLLSRNGNAAFLKVFSDTRTPGGLARADERTAVERLNAAEDAVLKPLDALQRIYARNVQQARDDRSVSDFQAILAAILGGLIAVAATSGLALYSRRLLAECTRGSPEQSANTSHYEYSEMLQAAESEEEADNC